MNTTICIGGRKKVLPSEIVLFIADVNYSVAYFENGKKIIVATNLGKLEERFAETNHFFRPNRSTLINLHYAEYSEKNAELVVQNTHFIGVSRRKKSLLMKYLKQ